ncbi:hypothetical protein [uncultured Draconibacterium sp.]|uniref:hypothetical protein n=1 Tax=uncultured Draconibacterium sp. TaxID=1573823 RepID=UPI003260F987
MNKMKNLGKILTIVALATALFACSDDDGGEPFEIIGDVFVIKRTMDDEVKYANSYAAWGNQPMSMAKVTTPLGAEITLSPASENSYTYAKEPTTSDYSTAWPVEDNYQFLVINEDITHQAVDLLDFDDIEFSTISSTGFVGTDLSVEWESNPLAEAYMIRLYNSNKQIAFHSQTLPTQMTRLDFGPGTASGSWSETPEAGKVYTLELLTFRFEDDATSSDAAFHIQEIAITETEVTWQ